MSDAQRQRPHVEGADPEEQRSGELGYASGPSGASLGSEHEPSERPSDESERVAVMADRPNGRPEGQAHGPIRVHVVGRTDVGLVREHNEDNYLLADLATGSREPQTFKEVPEAGLLLAVCDGMGGAAAGEVASQMAVDTLYEMMRRAVPCSDRDGLARALVRSVEEAGARIFESARADRSKRGMGTTATVASLMDKTLFVGQVGDSRAYIIRNGELKQITKDQSLVNQLIEAGQLTEDEAEAFEHSNIILQALGTTEQVSVDLTFLELRQGDRLLMCSDGLSGLVHGDVIREVLSELGDLEESCERLIELAKAGGGHDNVTVILAEFSGEGLPPPQPTDLLGYQQYPLPLEPGDTKRSPSPIHSDMPTLAPPSLRAPPPVGKEPNHEPVHAQSAGGATGRLVLFAILIAGAAGAVYYWMAERQRPAAHIELQPADVHPPVMGEAPKAVPVLVSTDVEDGELLIDGESHGQASDGGWALELTPGMHTFEAHAGGSTMTSKSVTLEARGPSDAPQVVTLSVPTGASHIAGDAGPGGERAASKEPPQEVDEEATVPVPGKHEGRHTHATADGGTRKHGRRREASEVAAPSGTSKQP